MVPSSAPRASQAPPRGRASWTPAGLARAIALGAAAVAAGYLLIAPTYRGEQTRGGVTVETSATLVEANGPWVLVPLAVPVVMTVAPILVAGRPRRVVAIVCTVLLAAFVVLGGLSIGLLFAPAAVAAIVALFLPDRSRR